MTRSARAWSVSKLHALRFQGDADALAAYVDALVENNRDEEGGDPALLRAQALADLTDFLSTQDASAFVDGLMAFLAASSPPPSAAPAAATAPDTPPTPKSPPPMQAAPAPPSPSHKPRAQKQPPASPPVAQRQHRAPPRVAKPSVIDRLGARRAAPPPPPPPMHNGGGSGGGGAPRKRGRDMDEGDDDRHARRRRGNAGYTDARRAIEDHRGGGSPPRRAMRGRMGGERERRFRGDGRAADGERNAVPFGFPHPMMNPEMMLKFPPPPFPPGMIPPGMLPPLPGVGGRVFRGDRERRNERRGGERERDARPRGGRGADVAQAPQVVQGGRKQYFVLAMRNVPEDKLKLPHILSFFEKYGTPDNVQLVTPDRAFIIYAAREPALAATKSVDAIMGNRHIRLGWATAQDYDVAGLQLTDEGVLQPSTGRRKGRDDRRGDKGERRGDRNDSGRPDGGPRKESRNASHVSDAAAKKEADKQEAAKAAEEDLRKKRAAIAEARAKQEEEKASSQARKKQLMDEQKTVFAEIEKASDQAAKLELFRKAKAIELQLKQVVSGLNPNASVGATTPRPAMTTPVARGGSVVRVRGRGRGGRFEGFSVDNRPKTLQIMGAKPDVVVETAISVFRETLSAEKVGAFWLLNFPTRRAAESAMRARGPLKRGFGPAAMSQIVAGPTGNAAQGGQAQQTTAELITQIPKQPAPPQPLAIEDPAENAGEQQQQHPQPEPQQQQPLGMGMGVVAQAPTAMMIDSHENGPS